MFTFSFGSAFAADTRTLSEKIDAAYNEVLSTLNTAKVSTINALADENTTGTIGYYATTTDGGKTNTTLTVSKAASTAVAEKVYAKAVKVLDVVRAQQTATADWSASTDYSTILASLKAAIVTSAYTTDDVKAGVNVQTYINSFDTMTTGKDYSQNFIVDIASAAFDETKADTLANFEKIDLSLYPDVVMIEKDPYKLTHRQYAEQLKSDYMADINDIVITAEDLASTTSKDAALDRIVRKINTINTIGNKITGDKAYTSDSSKYITYKFKSEEYAISVNGTQYTKALTVKDDLDSNSATLEAKKAEKLAKAQQAAATFYADAISAYTDKTNANQTAVYNKAVKEKDAFVETMTVAIKNVTAENQLTTADTNITGFGYETWSSAEETVKTRYSGLVDAYKALEDYAAECKILVEKDGELVYNASKIDENLAEAKDTLYGEAILDWTATAATESDIIKDAKKEADLDWTKKVAIAKLAAKEKEILYEADGTENYYAPEKAKVEALFDTVEAKINAATTVAQVGQIAVNVAPAGVSSVKNKTAVRAAVSGLSKFNAELTKVQAYVNYLNTGINSWEDGYRTLDSAELAKFYADNDARTDAEIVALVDKAKEWAATIPTNKEIKDEKAALEAQIKALPNYITLADKEAVKAAWTAVDDATATPDNATVLANAVEAVKVAEAKAITDMFKALPDVSKITLADKAAVNAAKEAIDVYESETMYKSGNTYNEYTAYDVDEYLAAVRDAAKADVEKQIAALPENASKAQVEAARKAYDEFVTEYTDAEDNYNAADRVNNVYRLKYAEKLVAENAVAAVEALKIKASSTAKKGSITVKWTVTGEADIDGYEIWKSTKQSKGFKKAFTTTKTTYKNTKDLKKGTRYYYKVRAYKMVDGVKVTSDWSNKAYRKAK